LFLIWFRSDVSTVTLVVQGRSEFSIENNNFPIRLLVAKAANLRFLWSGVTEKPQPKAARHFFDFAAFDRTTPKMNNGHAGSAVAAVLATLISPAVGLGTTTLYL
jgi:hypothetical protein